MKTAVKNDISGNYMKPDSMNFDFFKGYIPLQRRNKNGKTEIGFRRPYVVFGHKLRRKERQLKKQILRRNNYGNR
mgnify:FL=1